MSDRDELRKKARTWERDWGERRTSGLITALADLAESEGRRADEAESELMQVSAAWEAERGTEPERALTCMLLALKTIRDQKAGMEGGFRQLIAQRDATLAELAALKGRQP